jgi:hypothetical protein
MLRCASAWWRVGGLWVACSVRLHPLLCVIRRLYNNGFTGPILASITALTRLVLLYAAPRPIVLPAESGVRMSTSWCRALGENRFSGSVPPTISALTALTSLCIPTPGGAAVYVAHASLREPTRGRAPADAAACCAAGVRGRLVPCGRILRSA